MPVTLEAFLQRVCIMLKSNESKHKRPSRKALVRAVASSTAVETGQSIQVLEAKLRHKSRRFAHIKLAD